MRYLYTLLFYLILPFVFLRLWWRSRSKSNYKESWAERLGLCPHRLEKCIWVHAISVGEILAAVPLIKELKKHYSHLPVLVTNMTSTGAARVKAAFGETVLQAYIPYDLPDAIARFLHRIHPAVVIIMETELWPNLFAACQRRHFPILIMNARLSEKSAQGYARIKSLTEKMLVSVHTVAAQSNADADRFIALGLPTNTVTVTGNLKFDLELPPDLWVKSEILRQALERGHTIWIAASTHVGEEEIILKAHQKILAKIPTALLILVPRHPERFDTIATLATQHGFQVVRRSDHVRCTPSTTLYLGDTMGELLLMYAVADVAFVGGSLVAVGGHNMLEPAALQKPVITGQQLFNFTEISHLLLEAKGMVTVKDAEELAEHVIQFFLNANYRKLTGENAYKVVIANRGALQKQFALIKTALDDVAYTITN